MGCRAKNHANWGHALNRIIEISGVIGAAAACFIAGFAASEFFRKEGIFEASEPSVRFSWINLPINNEGCRTSARDAIVASGLEIDSDGVYYVVGKKKRSSIGVVCVAPRSMALVFGAGMDGKAVEAVRQNVQNELSNKIRLADVEHKVKPRSDVPHQALSMVRRRVDVATCRLLSGQALSRIGATQVDMRGDVTDGIVQGSYVSISCDGELPIATVAVSGFVNELASSTRDQVEAAFRVAESSLSYNEDTLAESPDLSVNWIAREMSGAECFKVAQEST